MDQNLSDSIETLAKACVSAFKRCLSSLSVSETGVQDGPALPPRPGDRVAVQFGTDPQFPAWYQWIENKLADFYLWADGVGAFANNRASLDHRFEARSSELLPVRTLLVLLKADLDAYYLGPTDQIRNGINAILDNLAILAWVIRRTGKRSRLQKYDEKFDSSNHVELERTLRNICLNRYAGAGAMDMSTEDRVIWMATLNLTTTQQRLVQSNLRRRNRFMLSYKHSRGLQSRPHGSSSMNVAKSAEQTQHPQSAFSLMQYSQQVPEKASIPNGKTAKDLESVVSTIASAPVSQFESSRIEELRRSRRPATAITAITSAAKYPKPPQMGNGLVMFKCPACFQSLPSDLGRNEKLWKNHLAEDIAPYTCILDDCPSTHIFYHTSKDWEVHVRDEHSPRWDCPMCDESLNAYANQDAFVQHIRLAHAPIATEDLITSLVTRCTVISIGVTRCPLCSSEGADSDPMFIQHVLSCIHDFSLTSLPWTLDNGSNSFQKVGFFNLNYLRRRCDSQHCSHSLSASTQVRKVGTDAPQSRCPSILPWLQTVEPPEDVNIEHTLNHLTRSNEQYEFDKGHDVLDESCLDKWAPPDAYFDVRSDRASTAGVERSLKPHSQRGSEDTDWNEDYDVGVSSGEVSLERQIRASFQTSATSAGNYRRGFLPNGELDQILTWDRVYEELARSFEHVKSQKDLRKLTRYICDAVALTDPPGAATDRRKIFATLVCINKAASITHFTEERLYDCHLPFHFTETSHGEFQWYRKTETGNEVPIHCFSQLNWSVLDHENFQNHQWIFQAPYFKILSDGKRKRPLHYHFDDGQVLPFIKDREGEVTNRQHIKPGGFSDVWRVQIHPAHHSHPTLESPLFAIKRLKPDINNEEMFKREVATLKRLSGQNHAHLIKLQLSYLYRKRYHLLFHWADGNLRDYWEAYPEPSDIPRTRGYGIWVTSQWLGLAEGLFAIHLCPRDDGKDMRDDEPHDFLEVLRRNGRHGDVKPENILWFQSPESHHEHAPANGRLVISDFGLTEVHRDETSGVSPLNVALSPTYRPPEYDVSPHISQSYDIWTLGCVLLDFIIWYLEGFDAFDEFSKDRAREDHGIIPEDKYFTIAHNVKVEDGKFSNAAVLKTSVTRRIRTLRQNPRITNFIVDALDLIEQQMIQMRPEIRANCGEVVEILESISKKTLEDEEYCVALGPRGSTGITTDVSPLPWSQYLPFGTSNQSETISEQS